MIRRAPDLDGMYIAVRYVEVPWIGDRLGYISRAGDLDAPALLESDANPTTIDNRTRPAKRSMDQDHK